MARSEESKKRQEGLEQQCGTATVELVSVTLFAVNFLLSAQMHQMPQKHNLKRMKETN